MKVLLIGVVMFSIAIDCIAENGSFLVLKSTYLFQNQDQTGRKILTRDRQAYQVMDMYVPKNGTMVFKIEFTKKTRAINGSGFIVETESELKELGLSEVKVYAEKPSRKSDLTKFQLVPSNQLSFTGRQEESPDFPKLTWKAVNYKTQAPIHVWVPEWAGIYRPDKNASWLNNTYIAAISKQFKKDVLDKVLNGQVETGFTKEQVRLALGNPENEQLIENDTKLEWVYSSRKVIFTNDIVSRVL
ncbi:MAG: hypothetical protein MJE63_31225 [Proteobacteria bacterium]|nr:hypothetical protein [Pseudomonadota bacterium]